jgi:hypothetical protein
VRPHLVVRTLDTVLAILAVGFLLALATGCGPERPHWAHRCVSSEETLVATLEPHLDPMTFVTTYQPTLRQELVCRKWDSTWVVPKVSK